MSTTTGAEAQLPQLVTAPWLAELFDVTVETIRNWVKKGMPKVGHAKYNPAICGVWVKNNERVEGAKQWKGGKETFKKSEWELRKLAAVTLQEELKTETQRGAVVAISVLEDEMNGILEGMRQQLKSIPGAWAGGVLGLETKAEAQDKLSVLVDDLMHILSRPPDLPDFTELEKLEAANDEE